MRINFIVASSSLLSAFDDMQIQSASYETSGTNLDECPFAEFPEFAFIGRSNVGKSSLINLLTNKKDLAIVSSKPGRTQMINFFKINQKWRLVDLPGYGYAKTSKANREKFQTFVSEYLVERENLSCVFVLIDARLKPQSLDLDFVSWLVDHAVPFVLVFTKTDKVKPNLMKKNMSDFLAAMEEFCKGLPRTFTCSAKTSIGKKEILNFIGDAIAMR